MKNYVEQIFHTPKMITNSKRRPNRGRHRCAHTAVAMNTYTTESVVCYGAGSKAKREQGIRRDCLCIVSTWQYSKVLGAG